MGCLLRLLGELYSPESETERFTEGEEGKGQALERALEALVRGLKVSSRLGVEERGADQKGREQEYSVEWKSLGKEGESGCSGSARRCAFRHHS